MKNLLKRIAYLDIAKVSFLAAVVGGIYYSSYYDPGTVIQTNLEKLQAEMRTEEAKRKDTEATLREVERMKSSVGLLTDQYQVISKKLPDQLSSREINRSIDGFARSSGVNVKGRKPSNTALKTDVIEEVPVDLVLEGTYSELALFVYYISAAERLARVKKISITANDSARSLGNNERLKLTLNGTVVGYKSAAHTAEAETTKGNKK